MRKLLFLPVEYGTVCTDSVLQHAVQTESPHLSVKIQNLKSRIILPKY